MQNKEKKLYISVAELAKMLDISRIAVFKRIKKGQIPAQKIGRSYAISMIDANDVVHGVHSRILTEERKQDVKNAVEKTVKEYGETLRLLGKE